MISKRYKNPIGFSSWAAAPSSLFGGKNIEQAAAPPWPFGLPFSADHRLSLSRSSTHSPPLLWLWESKPERTPHKERAAGHLSSLGEANQRSAAPLPLKQKTRSPLSCHFSLWPFGLPSFPCWGGPTPSLLKNEKTKIGAPVPLCHFRHLPHEPVTSPWTHSISLNQGSPHFLLLTHWPATIHSFHPHPTRPGSLSAPSSSPLNREPSPPSSTDLPSLQPPTIWANQWCLRSKAGPVAAPPPRTAVAMDGLQMNHWTALELTPRSLIVTCADAPPATTASSAIFNHPDSNQQRRCWTPEEEGKSRNPRGRRKTKNRSKKGSTPCCVFWCFFSSPPARKGRKEEVVPDPWFFSTHERPVAVARGGDALPLYHNHRRCPEFSSTVPEAIFVIFKCCCVCLDILIFWFTCFCYFVNV